MLGGDFLFQECRICGKSKMPFPLPFFHSLCFKFIFLLARAQDSIFSFSFKCREQLQKEFERLLHFLKINPSNSSFNL
jgi:hypothetical protein